MELPKLDAFLKRILLPTLIYFEEREPSLVEDPTPPPQKARDFILHFAKQYRWIILGTVIFSSLNAALDAAKPIAVGWIVDLLGEISPQTAFSELALPLSLIIAVFLIGKPLASYIWHLFVMQGIVTNFANRIRWNNHRYVVQQSWTFFQNDFSGRIATKIMQLGHATSQFVEVFSDSIWYVLFYIFATTIYLASVHWTLFVLVVVWIALFVLFSFYALPKTRKTANEAAEGRSFLVGQLSDTYSNIQTVKLFAQNEVEDAQIAEAISYARSTLRGFSRVITLIWTAQPLINGFAWCAALLLCIKLWSLSIITSGEVAATLALCYQLSNLSGWALRMINTLFESLGTVENSTETISQPLGLQDGATASKIEIQNGAIVFNDVSFSYIETAPVLKNINLNIKSGERIGLIGPSGAGKSTLINLLLRLYDVESGSISIDGYDIQNVSQQSLRSNIGVVSQDTALFNRSIRENVAYAKSDATEDEIIAAIKKAEAYEFIMDLVDKDGNEGLDARVGERGVKLSGGQRQRIAIARVLLKDAPILILDEATSALDSETEAIIQQNLNSLMQGRTVIAIAHRLSTINQLDYLVVLKNGIIQEQGNHQNLLQQNGLYAELWHRQSGGFIGKAN